MFIVCTYFQAILVTLFYFIRNNSHVDFRQIDICSPVNNREVGVEGSAFSRMCLFIESLQSIKMLRA